MSGKAKIGTAIILLGLLYVFGHVAYYNDHNDHPSNPVDVIFWVLS